MVRLHIEHTVPNFDAWKAAFDSDPVNRKASGVRRYQVLRTIDNPNAVIIDLEFDDQGQARSLLAAMQQVWGRVTGALINEPRWHVADVVESVVLQP